MTPRTSNVVSPMNFGSSSNWAKATSGTVGNWYQVRRRTPLYLAVRSSRFGPRFGARRGISSSRLIRISGMRVVGDELRKTPRQGFTVIVETDDGCMDAL